MGFATDPPARKPWVETPLRESASLSAAAECRIFLKLETLQPSGSFKSRGIGNLVLTHSTHYRSIGEERPLHFFASSAGNAGLACVKAAVTLGHKCSVVIPEATEECIVKMLWMYGATQVIKHGAAWSDADAHLRQVVMPQSELQGDVSIYIPPFDHDAIWEGAATIMDEIACQMPDGPPDAIVCSVGGGGLLIGIARGMDRLGWAPSKVHILAAETHGADSLSQSILQGSLITLPRITSIATSLGVVQVSREALKLAQHGGNVTSVVLEDAEAAMGCWRLADEERILVEPACGVSVALAYDGRLKALLGPQISPTSKVVIIVCGGSKVSLDTLVRYRGQYGERAHELGNCWRRKVSI